MPYLYVHPDVLPFTQNIYEKEHNIATRIVFTTKQQTTTTLLFRGGGKSQ